GRGLAIALPVHGGAARRTAVGAHRLPARAGDFLHSGPSRRAAHSDRTRRSRGVLPAALPSVLTGSRIALVISCIVVFLAEMITSTDGLGHLLVRAARNFQTVDLVW